MTTNELEMAKDCDLRVLHEKPFHQISWAMGLQKNSVYTNIFSNRYEAIMNITSVHKDVF